MLIKKVKRKALVAFECLYVATFSAGAVTYTGSVVMNSMQQQTQQLNAGMSSLNHTMVQPSQYTNAGGQITGRSYVDPTYAKYQSIYACN